jgi:YD repeat-containing protein
MVETADKTTTEQSSDNYLKHSEKIRNEVVKLYDSVRDTMGTKGVNGEHMALGANPKTLESLPNGGVANDGSLVFNAGDDNKAKPFTLGDKDKVGHAGTEGSGPHEGKGENPTKDAGVTKDANGHVTEVVYPNGQTRQFGYDDKGALNRIVQPDGKVIVKDGDNWKYEDSKQPGTQPGTTPGGGHETTPPTDKDKAKEVGGMIAGIMGKSKGPDIVDPKVAEDGTFTYGTKDGAQHTVKTDGTGTIAKDGTTVAQDATGKATSVDYGNGQKRSFEYDKDGQLNKVTDTNGSVYSMKDGKWVGADGKQAPISDISIGEDGRYSYQNKDGQKITQNLDRTSDVVNPNGTTMKQDADGKISEIDFKDGKKRTFTYDADGVSSITEGDGTVVNRGADGKWSDGRTDVTVGKDGTLQYTDKDRHIVIQENDGSTKTSEKTADELHDSAKQLHDLLALGDSWLTGPLTGPLVAQKLQDMSPTDRVLMAQEYEKQYGHKLGDDLDKMHGDAAGKAGKLLYTAELQEYAQRNIPDTNGADGKNQRQAFLDNMNEFLNRADKDHVSDKEVSETLKQILRVGESPNAQVTGEQRIWLTQQIMHNAAHPDLIDQGGHNTCNVTDVEMLTYTRNPSVAAKMIADVALTGEYTAADGKKITIPPQNLIPDAEARQNPPEDGRRSFASQIFQATTLNDAGQRWDPPKYFANIPPEGGADTGEFWTDANGKPLLREQKDKDGNVVKDKDGNPVMEPDRFGGLGYLEISQEVQRLTGEKGAVLVSWGSDKPELRSFNSEGDLRKIITDAQKDGHMPLIIDVTADDKLFGGNKPVGDKDRGTGNHVVVIRDYNPTTGMVRLDNSWGSEGDRWVPLSDLYTASK